MGRSKFQKQTEELLEGLNRYLPEDIAVSSLTEADERFHSRYQAKSKTYLYRIDTGEVADVFKRRYVYHYPIALDVRRMRRAADLLIGTHDFRSFCGNKKMKKSTVRTLSEITIAKKEQELQIFYTGNGFLQNMVRILTGTLIEIGDGRRQPEEIEKILKNAEVVVEDEVDLDRISVGCKVKVHDYEFEEDMELKIVGSTEANSLEGKISNESPVGKALIGAHTNDIVEVEMPSGIMKYKVLEIQRNV